MRFNAYFQDVQEFIEEKQRIFAGRLNDMVSPTGDFIPEEFKSIFADIVKEFEGLIQRNLMTDFLVVKLSPYPEDVHVVISPEDEELFSAKVRFIEKVFEQIKYTKLFFDKSERLIVFLHSETYQELDEFLQKSLRKIVSLRLDEIDERLIALSKALVMMVKAGLSPQEVECHFCSEILKYKQTDQILKLVQKLGPIEKKVSKLEKIGEESYGFSRSEQISLIILLLKMVVFPDIVVFFYPSPRVIKEDGQGGIVWGVKIPPRRIFSEETLYELLWSLELVASLLCSCIDKLLLTKYWRQSRAFSLLSAIARIMGRVLAHDWSHLLFHAELPGSYKDDWFRHFKSYLKERMVFVADVTTSQPSWTLSLPFLSQIVQPFTYVSTSYFTPEPPRTAVSQCIAQSEGVTEINVKVYHKGKLIELKPEEGKGMWLASPHDIYVSIPSGIVGNHALYCFLENFARNSAKYSPKPPKDAHVLNIFLRIDEEGFEGSDELYRVRIWDDRSCFNEAALRRICEFFPPVSLKHLPGGIYEMASNQNWRIVDDKSQIVPGGWGIKEMRIAAAWLRGYPPDEVFLAEETAEETGAPVEKTINPPLLCPVLVNENGEIANSPSANVYIGYEFYLLKPKEALLIDPDLHSQDYDTQGLRRIGVDLKADLRGVEKPRHHLCFVRLPEEPEGAKEWLQSMQQQREDLPAALLIVSEQISSLPYGTASLKKEVYEKIREVLMCRSPSLPEGILIAYKCWLQGVMNAPEQLTLVLHINPQASSETPEGVFTLWKSTAAQFNKLFSPWQMYVVKRGIVGSTKEEERPQLGPDVSLCQCPQNLMVYDYHYVFSRGSPWNQSCWFVEGFGGVHPTHSVLYNPPTEGWTRLKVALGLVEAAVAKTVIVDERIWRRLNQARLQNAPLAEKLERTRIVVPENFNYERPSESDAEDLLKMLSQNQSQILIIHQGILDKMFQYQSEAKRAIENWVEKVRRVAKVPFIVVVSDRGIPENVPENARFADYALVDKFVSETGFSKFHLVQSALAATKASRRR